MRRARQGDRAAFVSLLRRYDPRLRRLALQMLADPKRLDRVLNRAYLKAWRSMPFFKRGEPPARWLYRIVYNTCLNEVRWEPARKPPPPPKGERVPLPAAPRERRLLALRALTPDERIPLVLVDGEGFGVEDAARMTTRPADEVADDLARARGRWRAFVMGEPEPPPPPVRAKEPPPPPRDESSDGNEVWPVTFPVQLMTRTALATLAAPSPQREPGGHVKLLGANEMGLIIQPPTTSRQAAPLLPADDTAEFKRPTPTKTKTNGDRQNDADGPGADAGATETDDTHADADTTAGNGLGGGLRTPGKAPGTGSGTGAGARRKRRRDAKRVSRTRERAPRPAPRDGTSDRDATHDTP